MIIIIKGKLVVCFFVLPIMAATSNNPRTLKYLSNTVIIQNQSVLFLFCFLHYLFSFDIFIVIFHNDLILNMKS